MRMAALAIRLLGGTVLLAQPAFEVASLKSWTSHELGGVHVYPGGTVGISRMHVAIAHPAGIHRRGIPGVGRPGLEG